MSTDHVRAPERATIDQASIRASAALLLVGQLLYILVTQFHAAGEANNHSEIFATYASSDGWKSVHVGQFLAMAVLVAGLLVFCSALDLPARRTAWAARLGPASAIVALALYAVLQAVDGVGNKEVDHAWVSAPDAEKAATFASAEAMRWLEWGVRSYHDFALGLALLLIAAAAMRADGVPRPIGFLMGLSGLTYLVQGWVVGSEGFSGTHTILILLAWILSLAWMVGLLVTIRRTHHGEVPRTAR
jgi:hypothetical protein